jgi:hypothetical protein
MNAATPLIPIAYVEASRTSVHGASGTIFVSPNWVYQAVFLGVALGFGNYLSTRYVKVVETMLEGMGIAILCGCDALYSMFCRHTTQVEMDES